MKPKLLLINPWIYDFAAYDLWSKPLGLLYIASFLRLAQYDIAYIDCLDKYDQEGVPFKSIKVKKDGRGGYNRTIVEKPAILQNIPRHFARYGIEESYFRRLLRMQKDAAAILITSIMTYWYPGVARVTEIVREELPGVPVILGGIYATLSPDHARQTIKPDYLITGPGELQTLNLISELLGFAQNDIKTPQTLDDYPYPAFDLINHPDYLPIMTTRGCPYSCSFCAQKIIAMPYTRRSTENVLDEFRTHYEKYNVKDFAFYDDALFIDKDEHIKVILESLIKERMALRLHSPNGLFAGEVDAELAGLMWKSGFKTIRLSFETSNEERRKDMYSKVSNKDMRQAVQLLTAAGYKPGDLEAYVMMGLPFQSIEEIIASIIFVHNLGVQTSLASFSPIPGTVEFERSVKAGLIEENIDPLLTNKSIFPLKNKKNSYDVYRQIRSFTQVLNEAAKRNIRIFGDNEIGAAVKSILRGADV